MNGNSRVDALIARGSPPITIVYSLKLSREVSCFLVCFVYTYKETIAWFVTWKT